MISVLKISKNQWPEYFTSFYEIDDTLFREIELEENDNKTIITKEEIEKTIKTLKNGKSPGEDGVTNELIKYGNQELTDELTKLLQNILNCGIVLTELKSNITIPLFKKGRKDESRNYKSITHINTV